MSKYKAITTQIADPGHICRALDDLGVPYEMAQPGEPLTVNGWADQRKRAEIVVRKDALDRAAGGYAFGDMGWVLDSQTGAYQLILDDYDERDRGVMDIVNGVARRCALLKLQDLALLNGFDLEVQQDEQGVQRVLLGGVR